MENKQIQQLCGISKATFYRYLHEYQAGGVEKLKELNFHRQESQLIEHKRTLEDYFREHPPATSAEAAARIEELSGIKRGPTQTREFLKKLGMKPRKVGQIPAKADVKEQEGFKEEKLEPRKPNWATGWSSLWTPRTLSMRRFWLLSGASSDCL